MVKELSQYVFVTLFTMFITIKAARNSCVLTICEELQILFADAGGI